MQRKISSSTKHLISISVLFISAVLLLLTATSQSHAEVRNGKIAFQTSRDGDGEIYVMNADGSEQTNLTNSPSSHDMNPDWSPDGSKIAFRSRREGDDSLEIYIMNAYGGEQTRLTDNLATELTPAWSPDGTKIAFTSYRDGNYEIYVMNADGSGQTRLTETTALEADPDWSPDGTRIAFDSRTAGSGGINDVFVMNADGSGRTNLTNNSVDISSGDPDWSPDGTRIAFFEAQQYGINAEILVMNADGSAQTSLTDNTAHDLEPEWSPDGTKIAFDSIRDTHNSNKQEIYVMNADGSDQHNISQALDSSESRPSWQRILADIPDPDCDLGLPGGDGPYNNDHRIRRFAAAVEPGGEREYSELNASGLICGAAIGAYTGGIGPSGWQTLTARLDLKLAPEEIIAPLASDDQSYVPDKAYAGSISGRMGMGKATGGSYPEFQAKLKVARPREGDCPQDSRLVACFRADIVEPNDEMSGYFFLWAMNGLDLGDFYRQTLMVGRLHNTDTPPFPGGPLVDGGLTDFNLTICRYGGTVNASDCPATPLPDVSEGWLHRNGDRCSRLTAQARNWLARITPAVETLEGVTAGPNQLCPIRLKDKLRRIDWPWPGPHRP